MPPIGPGKRLDRYHILSLLGAGGMGEVYLAQDLRLGRKVALKFLPPHYTQDQERLRRFEQEAYAVSALNHPNIITIYEVGHADETHFIATEYIEGTTLRRRMSEDRLTTDEAIEVAAQVASALVAAHAAGIIHRDIKPENIMIRPDGYVKILDFGLAKLTERIESDSIYSSLPTDTTTGEITADDAQPGAPGESGFESDPGGRVERKALIGPPPSLYETAPFEMAETAPGIVLGTAAYMSPEHARGLKVDPRTDIFSLGVVLYEMLADFHPFRATSRSAVISAIINLEALPISQIRPDIPEVLEWIISKALQKDRDERYQTARELLNDLRRLQHRLKVEQEMARASGLSTGYHARESTRPKIYQTTIEPPNNKTGEVPAHVTGNLSSTLRHLRHRRGLLATGVILLIFGLAVAAVLLKSANRSDQVYPFQSMRVSRFTTTGRATRAAISPDGKYVVYALNDGGKQSLRVRQVATTSIVEIVAPSDVIYRGLTFSHDGNFIYYVVQEGNNPIQVLYQVGVLGGQPRKILSDIDSPITISPDGSQMAFVRRHRGSGEDAVIVAQIDGSNERKLSARKGTDFYGISGCAWSLDGKIIACPAGSNAGGRYMNVVEIRLSDGLERPISANRWSNVGRIAWLREGGLVIAATEAGSTLAQVWHLPYPNGEPRKITNDLNDYRDMSLTADSRALVSVQSEAHVNIWLAPQGDSSQARQVTSGAGQYNGVRGLTWMPDGRIVYVSRMSGSQDIWIMKADGTQPKQLTTAETRADVYPAVSPDGRIVFVSTKSGNSNIYRMDPDGGNMTALTGGSSEEFPDVSPDGKWVVFTETGSSKFTLWRVPLEGGNLEQLTDRLSTWPAVSPDGQWIACWYRAEQDQPWLLAVIPFNGGAPVKTFEVPPTAESAIPVRWMPDGSGLCYVNLVDGASNVWVQPLDGAAPRPLTRFTQDQIFWFSWSRKGDQLAVSRGAVTSDVVLFTEAH